MSRIDASILDELKKYSKDETSFKKLVEIVGDIYTKVDQFRNQLDLLEGAIRHDYDSIIITELNLENPGPKIVYVNDGFTKMTGYLPEEVIGKTPRILQGPKTDRAILDRLKRRLIEGQAFFGHSINYRKDGSEFINQWDIHPLLNREGEVTHWVSYQRDVTEKKETAKAIFNTNFDELLKRTEEFTLKFELDESSNSLQCKYITEAFEDLTGLEKSLIFDSGIETVLHDDDIKVVETALQKAINGETVSEYCRYKTVNGDYISVLQSFRPEIDESSNTIKTIKSVAKLELKENL